MAGPFLLECENMAEYTDAQLADMRAKRVGNMETRAVALGHFVDELTEQVHFAAARFGHQNIREIVATIRGYCDKLEDTIPPAGDDTSVPDKTERLNAAIAIAVLAFRAHYGD